MCESQPHPRPRSGRLTPSLQFWGVELGIRPYSKPFKVKDSFINKSPSPPNIIPKINITPPWGMVVSLCIGASPPRGPAPLVLRTGPQSDPLLGLKLKEWHYSPSEWVGPSVVSAPQVCQTARTCGEHEIPLCKCCSSLVWGRFVTQLEALCLPWNQRQGN